MALFTIKIEKLVVVHDAETQREILHELREVGKALHRLEKMLPTEFEQLKEASDEQKTELANLAGAIESLITRLGDNPTPEQIAEITAAMRGVTDGIRTATGTVSTLDPAGDTPPPPANP